MDALTRLRLQGSWGFSPHITFPRFLHPTSWWIYEHFTTGIIRLKLRRIYIECWSPQNHSYRLCKKEALKKDLHKDFAARIGCSETHTSEYSCRTDTKFQSDGRRRRGSGRSVLRNSLYLYSQNLFYVTVEDIMLFTETGWFYNYLAL